MIVSTYIFISWTIAPNRKGIIVRIIACSWVDLHLDQSQVPCFTGRNQPHILDIKTLGLAKLRG